MRRLALAIVLACALSGMAHAGEIHTTGATTTQTTSSTVLQMVLTILGIVR